MYILLTEKREMSDIDKILYIYPTYSKMVIFNQIINNILLYHS